MAMCHQGVLTYSVPGWYIYYPARDCALSVSENTCVEFLLVQSYQPLKAMMFMCQFPCYGNLVIMEELQVAKDLHAQPHFHKAISSLS